MRENRGDEVILRCSGRIVAGEETWNLYHTIIAHRERLVVLDLTGVTRIDAGGLGALVAAKLWANGAQVGLQVIPSKAVQELLDVTNLGSLLEIGSVQPTLSPAGLSGDHDDSEAERRCA